MAIALFIALSFIPFLGAITDILAIAFLVIWNEDVALKENKFNKFWFN